jgi:hypothetical protein
MTDAESKNAALNQALESLHRHGFEHAQIMVTWNEEGETRECSSGHGNLHARISMARDFVRTNDARVHHHVRKTEFSDPS